jgi:3-deoxy-D-manno-octulosonic-acid transferase
MFFIYEVLGLIFIIFSPIIFFIRIIVGKEDPKRFLEKFCIYSKRFKIRKTIWLHGSSVGEILSVIPIINVLEKNKKIKKIILTSSTTSSALIFSKYKFKKTTHIYFPIDTNYLTKKFIKYWKPQIALFIDSEIWPNMFNNLKINNIPIILLNGRITKKSFKRWMKFPYFAKKNFSKISLAMPQNNETSKYLKTLGVKKIKIVGNLKYFGQSKKLLDKNTKKLFKNRLIFCAASTHYNEELFIGKIHKELKLKYNNLLTILIPRHANRSNSIANELENIGLKIITRSSKQKISKNTDIYIADTYGETSKFYGLSNITFLGGSLVPHGGQNPLEPARMGSYILHGPNIQNFKEVYNMLSKLNISSKINSVFNMKKIVNKKIKYKQPLKVSQKLNMIGNDILKKNLNEINKYL